MSAVPDQRHAAGALDRMVDGFEGVAAAMFALRDGRPFAWRSRSGVDGGKLAAMTSSLAALGRTVLRELHAGDLDHLLVEGTAGKLVVITVPESGGLLVLAVLADPAARLGLVLGHAKMCARSLSVSPR